MVITPEASTSNYEDSVLGRTSENEIGVTSSVALIEPQFETFNGRRITASTTYLAEKDGTG